MALCQNSRSMVYVVIFLQGHALIPHGIFPTAKHQILWVLLSYAAKAAMPAKSSSQHWPTSQLAVCIIVQ